MQDLEKEFKKEIDKKNINNKNYFWILSILFFSTLITIYSYETNSGIIAKQTIDKNIIVKNQNNLQQQTQNKSNQEKIQNKEVLVSKENLVQKVADKNIEEKEKTILKEEKTIVLKEEKPTQNIENKTDVTDTKIVDTTKKESELKVAKANTLEKVEQNLKQVEKEVEKDKTIVATSTVPVLKQSTTKPTVTKPLEEQPKTTKDTISTVLVPKTNFEIISCYNFEAGKTNFTEVCKKNFELFIKNNNQAKHYEIIGLIDIYDVQKLANKSESSQRKLAIQRVQSAKNFLKNKTTIPVSKHSYYLKSEIATKGVVLRAYF